MGDVSKFGQSMLLPHSVVSFENMGELNIEQRGDTVTVSESSCGLCIPHGLTLTQQSAMSLNGWHQGELAIQHKMGYAGVVSQAWTWIEPEMREQHQVFYTTRLPFIPVTTIDSQRRPWSSILTGSNGLPGFATSRSLGELTFNANVWEGDPFRQNVAAAKGGRVLIAGISVEFSTRRRNKFAGYIEHLETDGPILRVRSVVNEAIGNCPKYINVRDLVPFADTHPRVVHRRLTLSPNERLPEEVVSFIHDSDTLFLGTYFDAGDDAERFPSHVGMNHRGGAPGFTRVQPSDGRTLVIPDYSGNRLMTSLGNNESTPLAGVTFVSFQTGTILYLTGDTHNLVGPAAQRVMPRTTALTNVYVTGYILVEDALPVRQKPGTQVQRSPYTPPVRYLTEETSSTFFVDDIHETPKVTLTRIEMHSHDLAAFTFESPTPIDIIPGQAIILDLKSFISALPYQHMAPENSASVNDDRIRTWTVSGSSKWASWPSANVDTTASPLSFTLTLRHKPGGAATTAFFMIARNVAETRPELLEDARPLQLILPLVGVTGDFTLQTRANACSSGREEGSSVSARAARNWLWIAGGIGVTRFLAMLAGLNQQKNNGENREDDIILLLSTHEPNVLLLLIFRALESTVHYPEEGYRGKLSIHVFSRSLPSASSVAMRSRAALAIEVTIHNGRLSKETMSALHMGNVRERQTYVCGPEDFEQMALAALKEMGVDSRDVRRDPFA